MKVVYDREQFIKLSNFGKKLTTKYCDEHPKEFYDFNDFMQLYYLSPVIEFNGGPVGIDAISSTIGEEVTTIEDVYEPYLLQLGLMKRTSRGRVVTDKAYEVLGIEKTDKNTQTSLDLN